MVNLTITTGAEASKAPPPKANPVDPALDADRRRLAAEEAKTKKFEATSTEWLKVMQNTSEDNKKEDVMSVLQVLMDNDLTTRNKAKGLDVEDIKDLVGFTTLSFPSRSILKLGVLAAYIPGGQEHGNPSTATSVNEGAGEIGNSNYKCCRPRWVITMPFS